MGMVGWCKLLIYILLKEEYMAFDRGWVEIITAALRPPFCTPGGTLKRVPRYFLLVDIVCFKYFGII